MNCFLSASYPQKLEDRVSQRGRSWKTLLWLSVLAPAPALSPALPGIPLAVCSGASPSLLPNEPCGPKPWGFPGGPSPPGDPQPSQEQGGWNHKAALPQSPLHPPGSHSLVLFQPSLSSQYLLPTPTTSSGNPRSAGLSKAPLGLHGLETTLPRGCLCCTPCPALSLLPDQIQVSQTPKPQCPLL